MTAIRTRRKRRQRHGTAESMALAIELWLQDVDADDPMESAQVEVGSGPTDRSRPTR